MSNEGWWTNHPWRLIQTNLREIDMADISADDYVRELESFGATIAMINTGGIIASYPTKLDYHFQSLWLTGDSLATIIDRCHAAGIRVIARTDFSKVRRAIYEQHPDWAYRTAGGAIVDYNGDVHVCLNGAYQQRYAKEIIREIVTTLPVDGIFFNMGGFLVRDYSYNHYGPCHCESCTRRLREELGVELDAAIAHPEGPAGRAYELAKRRWVAEHEKSVYELVKSLRPDMAVDHYEFQRQESNTEIDRALPRWQYDASSNTRWARTSKPQTISTNTSVDFIGFPYRHVAVNPAQQELRLWQSLANGGAVDYYLIGRLDNHRDRSGFERIRNVFAFHARNEALYRRLESQADVLLIRADRAMSGEDRGWVRVLTEAHYLFDEALLSALDRADLARYRCVIAPDLRYLSDAAADRLDHFVARGGLLVATGRTGFASDTLVGREVPALRSLGIERVTTTREQMRSAMFELASPLAIGTDLVFFGDTYIEAEYAFGSTLHTRLIPPHDFGPPERCYFTERSDLPGYVVTSAGRGRAIYLPWYPGALFHREGYVNTFAFLTDLLASEGELAPLETNASPMLEITLQRSVDAPGVRLLSLVNASGHFASTIYDPLPMRDVTVVLPYARAPRNVVSLHDGRTIHSVWNEGRLLLRIDVTGACEVVAISE